MSCPTLLLLSSLHQKLRLQRLGENINISCLVNLGTEIHGREYTFCCDRGIVQVVKITFRKEYRLKVMKTLMFIAA
jgi:hypothetical protein